MYGSGSGSFYHQAKIVRKSLISTALWLLYDFLLLKNDVNVVAKKRRKKSFLVAILKVTEDNSRIQIRLSEVRICESGSVPKCHGSTTLLIATGNVTRMSRIRQMSCNTFLLAFFCCTVELRSTLLLQDTCMVCLLCRTVLCNNYVWVLIFSRRLLCLPDSLAREFLHHCGYFAVA
jgi:hypothetical protein